MAPITILCSALLIIASIGFFFGSASQSMTMFIPAYFGGPLLLLGIALQVMRSPARRHVAHAAAALALLGALMGLGMGIPGLITVLTSDGGRPLAVALQLVLGVLCAVIVITAIASFRAARKAREAEAAAVA